MPMLRYQIRNEYGLSDPELYAAPAPDTNFKDDPEALLEAVAMAGLVGLLRQLGDLSEFAAEIFHDLHEEVMATASRGHGLTLRLHQLEAEFPSVGKDLISRINLPNVTQNEGIQLHTNVHIDQNLITRGDMPRFVMDSYEECRGPPRLFTLDKFDVAGAGACLKRYSDPSFFKTELASSYSIETEDAPRERKPRKVKKKAIRWKKGETLESLLTSSSESPASPETQSSGKALLSRVVKLKYRRLRNSDYNTRKIYHSHILELLESQQKIVLEDSRRQSNIKPESNGMSTQASVPVSFETENELQKMNKVYPIQEQNESSSGSEKIEIGFETSSSRQTREKTMTDSDDMASEHENFVDALNTIEMEMETDNENKSKSDPVTSSQKEMMHDNLHSDSVGGLAGTDKGFKLNGENEYGEATEEFFDNDDLMEVSSTSSLHSDGVQQIEQLSVSHGNDLMAESKVPADDKENELGALRKASTVDKAQLGFEDLVRLPTQTHGPQEQTNFTDSSTEISDISGVILSSREIKFLEETPFLEDSLGPPEENKYLTNNRNPADPEELEEPLVNPIEVSQVELRNISEEILNLEEYLISTRKDESISRDAASHGGKDVGNYANTAETLDVCTEENTQDFNEDKFEDHNERLQHEHSAELEDVLNGDDSVCVKKEEEIVPGSTASIPTEDTTDLRTQITGLDLEEALCEIRIQPSNDPTTFTSIDYLDNGRNTSNHELEASSREPQSPISIPEETRIQGSYPKYHMDDFIEPDEGLLDPGETKEETYRDQSSQHCVVETQAVQFNESEVGPQHLNEDESAVLLINHEQTDESSQGEKNVASKLHELSVDGDDSLEACVENSFCTSIPVKADGMPTNKLASLSPNEECEMWVGDFEVGEKEEGPHQANFLFEPTGSTRERIFEPELDTKPTSLGQTDAVLQTDGELGSPDTSLQYEIGDCQVPEKETEMELCYMGDANNVHGACEEKLFAEYDSAHANVAATSIKVNELLEEDLETKYLDIFEEGKVKDEALVECSKLNEEGSAIDGEPIPFMVKTELLVEAFRNNEKESAESILASSVVTTESFVEFSKLNEDNNGKGSLSTPFVMKNEVLVESLKNNEEDVAEGDVSTSPVLNNEALVEITGFNEECNGEEGNAEGGVPKPIVMEKKVLVEALDINEKDGAGGSLLGAGGGLSASLSNEVLVKTSEFKEECNADTGVPLPLMVKSEVPVETLRTDEKDSAEGSVSTSSLLNNLVPVEIFESNDKGNCEVKEHKTENEVSVESINETEEESADAGLPTPSMDLVHEILQEPTNLSCQEPDTPPSSTYEECHHESVGCADLGFTSEEKNITQSCAISLDNPLFDASPCENLSEEFSELHSSKPVPNTNLHNDQEKLQEDINQIATETLCSASTSDTWTVDPKKSIIAESFGSSSIVIDQKVPQEGFDLKTDNILSANKSMDEVLVSSTLANTSIETKGSELDMCSAYSLASEHKPPPLPPLGWRMGGKLSKGTSLPSHEHSSIHIDDMNPKVSVQIKSMEAPPIAYHADCGRVEEEKIHVMSLSNLPPLSCQHELRNANLTPIPFSGANVQNVEYTNGSSDVFGLTGPEMRQSQHAWPDAQHPHPFLPVSAWTTRPSLVQVNQPGYLISLEDNLWAQYGIGTPVEDERLIRKHHSIRNMPRNPLMDAVAAHDRSTMRKVSELVKPDDEAKAVERNSLLEQIRNKSFSLRPVGAQKTTSVKAPQTNLKVAAIVEKANAIRQAFVGSDEEDGDSWSDA